MVLLAIGVYAMMIFVVPHHFNDKVAVALAGLFAGVVLIATRARFTPRPPRS